jgi:hypothetical protein
LNLRPIRWEWDKWSTLSRDSFPCVTKGVPILHV